MLKKFERMLGGSSPMAILYDHRECVFWPKIYTERIKFSNFFKCLYCCCFEKYYNAAGHIQLV